MEKRKKKVSGNQQYINISKHNMPIPYLLIHNIVLRNKLLTKAKKPIRLLWPLPLVLLLNQSLQFKSDDTIPLLVLEPCRQTYTLEPCSSRCALGGISMCPLFSCW